MLNLTSDWSQSPWKCVSSQRPTCQRGDSRQKIRGGYTQEVEQSGKFLGIPTVHVVYHQHVQSAYCRCLQLLTLVNHL